jgi:hypothetical protein
MRLYFTVAAVFWAVVVIAAGRAHAIFDQGAVSKGVLSAGRPYEFNGFNRPSSILVIEALLIENGKIRRVEMIGPSVPYHLNSP